MNTVGIGDGEFWDYPQEFPTGDELPETLAPLLEHIFRDWGPELVAHMEHYNAWVEANSGLPAGHLVSASQERRVHPVLGKVNYELRGCTVQRLCAPQALWHFDRALALARGLEGAAATRWRDLLARTGGDGVMSLRLARGIARRQNLLTLA